MAEHVDGGLRLLENDVSQEFSTRRCRTRVFMKQGTV